MADLLREVHETLRKARSIDLAWAVYEKHIVPVNAGSAQRLETKRAFYAGIDWYFKRMLDAVDDEADAMHLISSIGAELDAYAKNIPNQ